ncbi:beta-N-acetylhexosaminidase [Celerinatantimonas sp. MCCC 1A17872]|uniref:beta-N-acetylhexosaminidase n=1 Tax=Celerinatantimonas sp. MCCC 1A17872 TaxID=3177514 RepID=UPI0038C7FF92
MGPLFLDLTGVEVDSVEREMLSHPLVAGVILFTRNYVERRQLIDLVRQIREARKEPLLIVVDQEGGRVQRFRNEFSALPAAGELEALANAHQLAPQHVCREIGWLMAAELRASDIDLSLAPVLDINGISNVIGNRAFASDAAGVVQFAQSYIEGMREWSMRCVGKHFPGHGSVQADSHIAQPIDNRAFSVIEKSDLKPFQELIKSNQLDAVMPAHVIYCEVDDKPAGFSKYWINSILKEYLGFKGLIFSDDLSMQAAHIAGSVLERAQLALGAGCDLLLACNDRNASEQLLDGLDQGYCHDKALALQANKPAPSWHDLDQSERYHRVRNLLEIEC